MVLKWNFQRGWGFKPKKPSVGEVWIFSGAIHFAVHQNKWLGIRFRSLAVLFLYSFINN